MKYKVKCKDPELAPNSQFVYKSLGLPSARWMEDNIGEHLIDWRCYVNAHRYDYTSKGLKFVHSKTIIEFKDEDKLVMFLLKCGDKLEQM